MSYMLDTIEPGRVTQARKRAGLSSTAAANMLGVTPTTWRRWEGPSGSSMPGVYWTMFLLLTDQHPSKRLIPRLPGAPAGVVR